MDEEASVARRERYRRLSAFPVFLAGIAFLIGFIEVSTSSGDSRLGTVLITIGWAGFVADLIVRWAIDEDPRTFARRNVLAIVAVLVPVFRIVTVLYVVVRLARGRERLQTKVQLYAAYLTVLVVTFGAAVVLSVERDTPGANIQTYGEAFWWAAVTVTTVGYGDYVPVSDAGRAVATLMLFNGVILISVVTASIASKFVASPDSGEAPLSLDDLDERLARIEAALADLHAAGGTEQGPAPVTGTGPGS